MEVEHTFMKVYEEVGSGDFSHTGHTHVNSIQLRTQNTPSIPFPTKDNHYPDF